MQYLKNIRQTIDSIKCIMACIALILACNQYYEALAQSLNNLPDRYALVIGISDYKNPNLRLNYADKDAKDFRNSLLEYGKFKKDNIRLLTDKEASRENIRKSIEGWLKRTTQKNDFIIIFFSGHGAQIVDSDGDENDGLDECIVPYDVDVDDNSSLISDDLFAYWVRNLESDRILIIFDNCFSGGAAKQKGILLPGIKGGKVEDDFSQDIIREVPRRGTALLAASKPEQVSFESDEFKNGIFSHYLIESISSKADNNINGIIDAQELFYYTRQKTLEYSKIKWKKEQEPILVNTIDEDLDIYYLPLKVDKSSSKKIQELRYRSENETNSEKKIELIKEALKLDPTDVGLNSYLASEYESIGRYAEALHHYEYLISHDLKGMWFYPPLSASIGDLYEKMGKRDIAITWYAKALEEDANSYSLHTSLGRLYLSNKDTLSAIQHFNKSIELQPLQKETYFDLFYIHLSQNSLITAYRIINNCYDINPNDFQAIYWFGLFQKYYNNNISLGDSLLTFFENNSGIARYKNEILKDKSRLVYSVNGKYLKGVELQGYVLEEAIQKYPYYENFYKLYIQFAIENNMLDKVSTYGERYLNFSKLNPDLDFIKRYIR